MLGDLPPAQVVPDGTVDVVEPGAVQGEHGHLVPAQARTTGPLVDDAPGDGRGRVGMGCLPVVGVLRRQHDEPELLRVGDVGRLVRHVHRTRPAPDVRVAWARSRRTTSAEARVDFAWPVVAPVEQTAQARVGPGEVSRRPHGDVAGVGGPRRRP